MPPTPSGIIRHTREGGVYVWGDTEHFPIRTPTSQMEVWGRYQQTYLVASTATKQHKQTYPRRRCICVGRSRYQAPLNSNPHLPNRSMGEIPTNLLGRNAISMPESYMNFHSNKLVPRIAAVFQIYFSLFIYSVVNKRLRIESTYTTSRKMKYESI